jgi:hypothetical protein
MAKRSLLTAVLLLCLLGTGCSRGLQIMLFNNTSVDLTVQVDKSKTKTIGPGQTLVFYWQEPQYIDFGAVGYAYENRSSFRISGFYDAEKDVVRVQAENDGRLYLVPVNSALPLQELSRQPAGYPLAPTGKIDLT